LRDETYTVAPASTNPPAIIRPIPREPPVTRAVLPAMENRSVMPDVTPADLGDAYDPRSMLIDRWT
jgi:hypothetical protein